MALEVVPIYAALLGLLYLFLTVRAIGARRAGRKAIGPLGEERLDRRMRAHANFAEYAPLVLLLLAFAELRGAPPVFLHVTCAMLAAGRCAHAFGVSRMPENFRWRVAGMAGTLTALALAALLLLAGYVA